MTVKIKFPIFVITNYGYEAYVDASDMYIRCLKQVKEGFFNDLEFIDSDGVLRKVRSITIDTSTKIPLFRHIFNRCKLCRVNIVDMEEYTDVPTEKIISRMIDAVCYVPDGVSKQFDKDELHYVLQRKKNIQEMIEYFSGPVPDFMKEYQNI